MTEQETRRYWLPIVVGFALSCGFGVLAVLWFTRGTWWAAPPARLAGLFDYPSAYLGDSLLLPVAVALMLAGAARLPRTLHDRMIAAFAGGLAAVLAVGTQLLWLADNHPKGNWTLPRAHRFNVAGVWHAVYFVGASALLMFALVLLSCRISGALRGSDRGVAQALLRGVGPSVLLSCLLTYTVLATRDSSASTFASRTSLVGLGVAATAFFVLAALVLRRSVTLLGPHLLLAISAAAAVALAISAPWSAERTQILGEAGCVLVGAGIALLTLVPGRDLAADDYLKYRPNPAQVPLVGMILVVLLPSIWAFAAAEVAVSKWPEAVAWLLGYVVAVAVVPVSVVRRVRVKWLRQAADVMVVSILLCSVALAALTVPHWRQASDSAPFTGVLVAIAISSLLFPILKVRMHIEIRDEQGLADDDGSFGLAGATKLSATATVGMLVISGLAGAVSLLAFTLAAAIDRKYVADSGAMPQIWPLLAVGAALIILTTFLVWLRTRSFTRPLRFTAPVLVLIWPITLVIVGIHGVPPVTLAGVGGGVLLALWSANTMLDNVGILRGDLIDGPLWAAAAAIAVSSVVSGFVATSEALAAGPSHVYTWFGGISTAAGVLVVNGTMAVVAGHLVAVSGGGRTRHGLTHNLMQDAVLMLMLYMIVLVIPATTLLHLPPNLGFWARFIATFAIVGPFLTYFLGPYQWQLDTNLGHVNREIETRSEIKEETRTAVATEHGLWRRNVVLLRAANGDLDGPPQHQFLRALNAHVRNQNAISNALIIVSLVGFIVLLGGKTTAALAYLRRGQQLDPNYRP